MGTRPPRPSTGCPSTGQSRGVRVPGLAFTNLEEALTAKVKKKAETPRLATRTKNVVITEQQFAVIEAIAVRRQCSFSEALRRVLDSWIDAKADGVVRA